MRIINAEKYLLWFIILLTFTKIMFERQNYIHTSTHWFMVIHIVVVNIELKGNSQRVECFKPLTF